jgi:hypothetical protein
MQLNAIKMIDTKFVRYLPCHTFTHSLLRLLQH